MLYPAELQALLQPRGLRLAQDFNLCLGRMLKRFAARRRLRFRLIEAKMRTSDLRSTLTSTSAYLLDAARQEPVGQEYFFSC